MLIKLLVTLEDLAGFCFLHQQDAVKSGNFFLGGRGRQILILRLARVSTNKGLLVWGEANGRRWFSLELRISSCKSIKSRSIHYISRADRQRLMLCTYHHRVLDNAARISSKESKEELNDKTLCICAYPESDNPLRRITDSPVNFQCRHLQSRVQQASH